MKTQPTETTDFLVAKAYQGDHVYFIFRNNGEEVSIKENATGTITTSHKLSVLESDYLREYYPFLFKSKN